MRPPEQGAYIHLGLLEDSMHKRNDNLTVPTTLNFISGGKMLKEITMIV
jgi:hypothetical protein